VEQAWPCSTFFVISMSRMKKHLPVLLILLFLAFLYFRTMAPGLSWAFDGADGGDLVTAASTGGIPHPSGYPTYLLFASLFLKLPVGSLAYRTNLLSGVCTILTAGMIYKIERSLGQSIFSATVASLAFGTFPLVWSQAIITEVNALNGLFTALLFYFFITKPSHSPLDFVWGILAGLGLGNHLIILFMLPLVFAVKGRQVEVPIIEVPGRQSIFARIAIYARRLAGLCLGLGVYFLIPVRASAKAPVNWGNAVSRDGLIWLVTGKLYWGRLDDLNGNYLMAGIQAWSHFLVEQLGIFGLLLVFIVLAFLFKRSHFYLASAWLVLIYSVFSILYYSPDSYVYLIPVLISISIWMGLGSEWVIERISTKYRYFKPAAELGIIAFILIHAILELPKMDLSADHTAERYAQVLLNSAPNKAIIFTEGDEATFALWYFHYSYHQRPDIALVSSDLLTQPWYKDVLNYTYPDLIIGDRSQEQDVILDNPLRTVCQSRPDLQEAISCSP
jgi:hypothetical protein